MEQRVVKLEDRVDKLEEKVEKQALEYAETKVYVKEIYKKLDDLKTSVATITNQNQDNKDHNNERLAKIIERCIWAIVTIVGYFVGKGLGV
jgi:peptidoglycan hydrolase CwlO-like protein